MTARGTISDTTRTILEELSDNAKEKVPADVYTQLTTGFVPAVKEVSRAGNELLKAYQAVQKCSEQYVLALKTLVDSSTKAFPGAKEHGENLNELVDQYSKMMDLHKKNAPRQESGTPDTSITSPSPVDVTKPASTSFVNAQPEEKHVLESTPPPVVQEQKTPRASFINKESPVLNQAPINRYSPSDWPNNTAEAPRREYITMPAVAPMEYRPEEPDKRETSRPPIGGRLVLPPVEQRASLYHVDTEFNQQTYAPSVVTRPIAPLAPKPAAGMQTKYYKSLPKPSV
ncbi:unnamed protein product [Strongylus vulgaris]|uniref:Uncharacterized protein n=1 Tax=Strongylus vulgaris TaxID=40348 RepID=A0A3P7JAB9_STRVU|nr:unnamed protein product [Strongylus vulgaris]